MLAPYSCLLVRETREALGLRLEGNVVIVDEGHNLGGLGLGGLMWWRRRWWWWLFLAGWPLAGWLWHVCMRMEGACGPDGCVPAEQRGRGAGARQGGKATGCRGCGPSAQSCFPCVGI